MDLRFIPVSGPRLTLGLSIGSLGDPSPVPPPDEVHRDGGPPSAPKGRGLSIQIRTPVATIGKGEMISNQLPPRPFGGEGPGVRGFSGLAGAIVSSGLSLLPFDFLSAPPWYLSEAASVSLPRPMAASR